MAEGGAQKGRVPARQSVSDVFLENVHEEHREQSAATELPRPPSTEQVVPEENVRVSLFERMRESFTALVGEPFDDTESGSEPSEGTPSEANHLSEKIPSTSSVKSLIHSEEHAEQGAGIASTRSVEAPRRPRLSSTISNMSIDPMRESPAKSVVGRQSLSSRKSVRE